MSELTFIQSIKNRQPTLPAGLIGIGDDAAVIESGSEGGWVVATDMLMEGRHFDTELHSLMDIGHKALAVNFSDIAAMGAIPKYALVSLAVPEGFGEDNLEKIWNGLQRLADDFDVIVIGGDTNSWQYGLVINVCVLGSPTEKGIVTRDAAKPGDELYVTGDLGGSMEHDHHLRFRPRIKEAQQIMEVTKPRAMIDLSDGLATDLAHMCRASGVGAALQSKYIPISPKISLSLADEVRIDRALSDGEDFELLIALPPGKGEFLAALPFQCYRIGKIVEGSTIMMDGEEITAKGYEHTF